MFGISCSKIKLLFFAWLGFCGLAVRQNCSVIGETLDMYRQHYFADNRAALMLQSCLLPHHVLPYRGSHAVNGPSVVLLISLACCCKAAKTPRGPFIITAFKTLSR